MSQFYDNHDQVVIVGAGLAGLFAALKLAPIPTTVISPAPIGNGASSAWAQGGVAAAIDEGDTPEDHARDTIAAGAGLVNEAVARLVAGEAAERIEDLIRYGVPFDKQLDGKLSLSREAAHSRRRIVRVKGDGTGKAIMAALIRAVRNTASICVLENTEATELVTSQHGGQVTGVHVQPVNSSDSAQQVFVPGRGVILTTGGIGHLYAVTTNPAQARGGGIAMAARAGATIANAEFVQFHPTAIDSALDPAPLATEALRGEGAVLVNTMNHRFMAQIHDDGDLAPRDIVARAVHREIASGRGAFLDCREAIGGEFPVRFPTVYEKCIQCGIDPRTELIPVAPAAHYHMGGVLTDANGRSTVDGLWACGEVAATGLHGANRLASNSLIEAVVFAVRIAEDISGRPASWQPPLAQAPVPLDRPSIEAREQISQLRHMMSRHVGVVRNRNGLLQALEAFEDFDETANAKLADMVMVARFITQAALVREESRGGHFRSDFPAQAAEAKLSYLGAADIAGTASEAQQTVAGAVSNVSYLSAHRSPG